MFLFGKVASIIYLESPVGVGFSYSVNSSDYVNGDFQTAAETHLFLLKVCLIDLYSTFQFDSRKNV